MDAPLKAVCNIAAARCVFVMAQRGVTWTAVLITAGVATQVRSGVILHGLNFVMGRIGARSTLPTLTGHALMKALQTIYVMTGQPMMALSLTHPPSGAGVATGSMAARILAHVTRTSQSTVCARMKEHLITSVPQEQPMTARFPIRLYAGAGAVFGAAAGP